MGTEREREIEREIKDRIAPERMCSAECRNGMSAYPVNGIPVAMASSRKRQVNNTNV